MKHAKVLSRLVIMILCSMLFTLPAAGQIIGYKEAQQARNMTSEQAKAIANQSWLFTHASVGGNMIKGMMALTRENADRYPFQIKSFNASDTASHVQLQQGCVYHASRGNPGWQKKYDIFDQYIRNAQPAAVKLVAMDKLCYVDQAADAKSYLAMMAKLEKDFPKITFVYTTMPIRVDNDSRNVQRHDYNQAVRAHIRKHGGLLFDIADIEAHTPTGQEQTFTREGQPCQMLCDSYTKDGGHLNDDGARQVALGWYAVAIAIAVNE